MIAVTFVIAGSFTFAQETGSFTDKRDAKVYKTVKIGEQWWMGENLAYKTSSGCTTYEDIDDYVGTYGYLYTWEVSKDVCPEGWHLPSDAEFLVLAGFLGGEYVAGGKMKEPGTDHWKSPNTGATNSSGFTALSSGKGNDNENKYYLGVMTYFWTSEDDGGEYGVSWALFSAKEEFSRYGLIKENSVSVRCIKD